jgi:voltage-gated sodium channel
MVRPEKIKNQLYTGIRGKVAAFVEHKRFVNFITALILINAVTLGMDTSQHMRAVYGDALKFVDGIIVTIFCIELILKISVYRLDFFRAGWNIFDFVIISISLIPASGAFSVMRALRVFRVLRLMSVVPQMRRVVSALFHAIPGMASIMGVLVILFYVFAVMATVIFGAHPSAEMNELFGTLPRSLYSLFQVMTLEGWSEGIASPTMQYFPWAWAFFVPFIFVTSFAVLNLFIGIIVDAMNIVQEQDLEEEEKAIIDEIERLREDISELKAIVKSGGKAGDGNLW